MTATVTLPATPGPYGAGMDGSDRRVLLVAQGNLTGIAYAQLAA